MTRIRAIALACVGMFAIAACGGGGGTTSTIKEGGTLLYALDADAQTLNPFEASDVPSVRAYQFMFPSLYQADKNLAIQPDLAASMPTVSADLKTWTVKLRTDAKWSDGTPVTSADVVSTVHIQANTKLDTDASFDWSALTDPVTGVTAPDAHTVVFTLTSPFAPFLAVNLVGFVAPASTYGQQDVTKMRTYQQDHPTVTGGPFLFTNRVAGSEIDLTANASYYLGKPHFAKVVLKIVTNSTAAAQGTITGDINWDPEITGAAIDTVKAASNVQSYTYPDLGYFDVRFNDRAQWVDKSRKSLFGDVNVRRAFAYGLDKNAVVKAATDGHGTPLWGDLVPASAYYDDSAVVKYTQDVAKANSLMDAAGWVKGADGIRVKDGQKFSAKFYVRAGKPQRIKAVQIISEQLRAIGMDLQPTPTDFKVFYKPIQAGNFDLAFAGFGLTLDPDDYTIFSSSQIRPENSSSGSNWTGYVNADLDAAINAERTDLKANAADTFAARKADFAKIEHILGDNVVVYMMWADNVGMAFNGVSGVVTGNGGALNYADQDRNVQVFAQWSLTSPK
ncbi:MAG: ABC transporter substrate-binding protein [Candidatus Dormibacteraeota bacterium]|nr:ABC transporter substrate-binding protein [Candidatus Dormibacteraeota bacterium]